MRIALTGATGFLGRSLCETLTTNGHTVIAWARSPESASRLDAIVGANSGRLEWRQGQLGSPTDAADLVRGCDASFMAVSSGR